MGNKIIFIFIALAIANAEYTSYKDYKVYKVVPNSEKDIQSLKDLENQGEYQFWSDSVTLDHDVQIMVSPEKQTKFVEDMKTAGIAVKVVIEDVDRLIQAQLRRPKINRINNNYDWTYYQTVEEIHDWMDQIAEQHSDVVTAVTIGTTHEGRELKGLVIDYKKRESANVGILEGGIHAREWISPATLTWVINEFLTSSDPDIRALAENIVWHIFPVVNPDGYAYTFTNNRMWRKNRNPVSFTSCGVSSDDLSNGIDLNRNFGFMWNTVGASSNPCSETYAGPVANSESETISIINYVQALQETHNIVYYFAFHSYSQMVLVPYSHVSGSNVLDLSNYGDLYEIAIKGMDKLQQRNGIEYVVGTSGDILYYVSGSSFDWARGAADIPVVYLFELRDVGQYGFLLPPELIKDNNMEIMDALVEMDRVTRQIGYYQRDNGVLFTLNILTLLLGLVIVM